MKGSLKKTLRLSLIALLMCLLPVVAAIGSPRGDVNGDGEVSIGDVTALIDMLLTGNHDRVGDVNNDGEVSIGDVTDLIDMLLTGNTDDPTPPDEGTDAPGLYMGITGFNQQLYTKPISILNRATRSDFTGFVSSLSTKDATVLYYAVDKSLDALDASPFPKNLRNVAIVTFTDGLDQGSLMLTDQGYLSDTQYASALSSRINGMSVHGCPLQAYTIGLKGTDVTNNEMFMSNLRSLASSEDNVALVNNMDEVKAKFQTIADNLAKTSYSYSHMLTLTIPGVSNGTRIRFTFDNVNSTTVANSQKYIEGTFNLASRTLTNVTYHGMTSTSGSTIRPKGTNGIFVTYAFDGLTFDDPSERINKNMIKEWYWVNDYSKWQINSEFTPGSIDDVEVEATYTSAIVMLVLDCSSSLGSDFAKLKTAANDFIYTLADYDSYNPTESTQTYTVNGVSFRMVPVKGGTFTMGATSEQGSDASSNESPTHQVTLNNFSIGQTEVTQELWKAVMGSNPSNFTGDLKRPVEYVSWNQCQTFITKLNQMTGETFRLPTEAEWEYAARGGNKSQGYKYAGGNTVGDVAWYSGNSSSKTQPVGTKAGNELGLYDMSGNVYEWCEDWYGNYTSDALINPTGPATGSYRVYRGGSWYHDATYCRTSYRYYSSPSSSNSRTGLRLAMYDLSSFDPLAVSTGKLQLTVGDKQSVSVTDGSGHYSVQSTSVVTATLSDGVVSLTAVIPGSTVVTVTDDITHEQASIRITVISAAPISTNAVTPGLYMSILGFNQQLYTKGFSLLNRSTKGTFTGFVNSLAPQDGTILYYAEGVALDSLVRAPYPQNLNNVVLVTFTDGLDQGSLMLTDKGYTSDSQYASALASRIGSAKVHGLPLQAYSIGLKGTDVTDDDMFMSNLRSLASSEDNVYLVNNINEVTAKFNDIANNLSMSSYTYSHTLTLTIPGISNGTRIRFTFDDVNSNTVANSQQYIEGTFNLANRSLTNVTYHGMTCSSGTTIMPKEVNGVYITYVFDNIVLGTPSEQINKNKIQEWYWVSNYNNWQINSEFTPSSIDDVNVQTIYSSAIVMLVLDSSSSLINDFSQLKSAANQFITTLADYDSFTSGTLSQNSITLTVGSEKTVEILNGSGSFTVSGGDGIVTARIEGHQLILTGKQEGTTTLTITDVATQTTMTLQVNVYISFTLSQEDVTMFVGDVITIDIMNGSGSFTVSGGDGIVTTQISGRQLKLTGKKAGTTTLTVTDKTTQISVALTINDYTPFSLPQSSVSMTVGSEKTVEILNGSGSFTVSGGDGIVTARIKGRQLILTGKQEGTTTLTITDVATQTTMTIDVDVLEITPVQDESFTVNGVSFKMVGVEGGTFTMGATAEQGSDALDNEKPAHEVTLSSFSIGETEVTQALWQAVMGSNPSYFSGDLNRPVEKVSWNDCQTFITKLNEMTGKTFRLPTEAEWEYAARGGNLSQGYKYAGSNTIDDVAWYTSNSGSTTHPVGIMAPNELGLYDMSGNVWEWCQDRYSSSYYSSSPSTNPTGPATGSGRVFRGGSWYDDASFCRVSDRSGSYPSPTASFFGLRLAL